jgi:hypothetical protein
MYNYPDLNKAISVLPKSDNKSVLITNWQSTNDLIKAMANAHVENMKYAKILAPMFRGVDKTETAQNVFNFIKQYIPYEVEPASKQAVKTIPRMLRDAQNGVGSDCKMYAVLCNTILNANKIPSQYRFVSFSGKNLTHTYCTIPSMGLVLDAVLPNFDTEKPFKKNKDMSLYKFSGFDDDDFISGIDFKKIARSVQTNVKKAVQSIPATAKKIVQGAKTVSLAIPRNAFLLLVKVNAKGLATKLKKMKDKNDSFQWWFDFGGNRTDLKNAIDDGAKKKAIFSGVIEENQSRKFIDMSSPDSTIGEPVTIATALASASPILIKVYNELKKAGIDVKEIGDTVKKASDGFEALTGKKVTDVIFKKDAGSNEAGKSINAGDLEPTDMTTATKIATKIAETQTGKDLSQPFQSSILNNPITANPLPRDLQNPTKNITQVIDWKKNTPYIIGAGVVALILFSKGKKR